MKKIYCLMLSALMMLNAFPAFVYASDTLSGEGTKENPYIISGAADYQLLSDAVKNGESYQGKYFIQTADFEFENAPADETAVYGMGENEFAGIYDGNGYTIALADDYKEVGGEQMSFSELCDWIVLFGAVSIALTNIYNLFANYFW